MCNCKDKVKEIMSVIIIFIVLGICHGHEHVQWRGMQRINLNYSAVQT